MVYLIESEGRNETYYKIGYTKDSNFEQRSNTYKLHNPFCKVLYTIPDATEDHERLIHAKFNEYLVYRKEWFNDSVEILRFFDRHRTKESLDNEFSVSNLAYFIRGADGRLTERYIEVKKEVKRLINVHCAKRLTKDNSKEIAKEYDTLINKYVPLLGKTIFSVEMFKECFSEGDLNNVDVDLGDDIKKFLEDFDTLPNFSYKMKALCNNNFSESERLAIFDQVPLVYKIYYLTIGPERCRAHGYNVTDVKREYEEVELGIKRDTKRKKEEVIEEIKVVDIIKAIEEETVDEEALLNNIYNTFQVGEFYSNKDVKRLLGDIYSSHGYKVSSKASELDKYFKTKRATRTVDSKQIEGVRILEKK